MITADNNPKRYGLVGGVILAGLLGWLSLGSALAGVIEDASAKGVLVVGTRKDSYPFGFQDSSGALQGFSIDILHEIQAELSRKTGKTIALEIKIVTPETRIAMIESHEISAECGITTATAQRLDRVDFSIPYFLNGTRILTRRSLATEPRQLAGKRIGIVVGGTQMVPVRDAVPDVKIVEIPDMATGLTLMQNGQLDGLSNINVVLRGILEQAPDQGSLILLPRAGALIYEPIACMLPQNDSTWRNFVNSVIASMLRGAVNYRGRYVTIYDKWFGAGSKTPIPLDLTVIEHLADAAYWLD